MYKKVAKKTLKISQRGVGHAQGLPYTCLSNLSELNSAPSRLPAALSLEMPPEHGKDSWICSLWIWAFQKALLTQTMHGHLTFLYPAQPSWLIKKHLLWNWTAAGMLWGTPWKMGLIYYKEHFMLNKWHEPFWKSRSQCGRCRKGAKRTHQEPAELIWNAEISLARGHNPAAADTATSALVREGSLKPGKSSFCTYHTLFYSAWQKSLPQDARYTSNTAAGDPWLSWHPL